MIKTLILVGRSCVGKDIIQKKLINDYGMKKVITYTTRPPREGEVDGVDYHFIHSVITSVFGEPITVFDGRPDTWAEALAECTKYHVASGETWYYGSAAKDYKDSDNKVIILNPDGIKAIREKQFPAFIVEITSPDKDIQNRQKTRGDEPEEAERRFDQDKFDFADLSKWTDTCVINWGDGGPDRCARNIYQLYQYWLERNRENVED